MIQRIIYRDVTEKEFEDFFGVSVYEVCTEPHNPQTILLSTEESYVQGPEGPYMAYHPWGIDMEIYRDRNDRARTRTTLRIRVLKGGVE